MTTRTGNIIAWGIAALGVISFVAAVVLMLSVLWTPASWVWTVVGKATGAVFLIVLCAIALGIAHAQFAVISHARQTGGQHAVKRSSIRFYA